MNRALIITGYSLLSSGLRRTLEIELQLEVETAEDDQTSIFEKLFQKPEIVLFDANVQSISCLELIHFIAQHSLNSKVIVLHSDDGQGDLIDLMINGCAGYLPHEATPADLIEAIHIVDQGKFVHRTASTSLVKEMKGLTKQIQKNFELQKNYWEVLTEREFDVLFLIANGNSNREIAEKLHISTRTVTNNVSSILNKLKAANRIEAAMVALKYNWLKINDRSTDCVIVKVKD